MRTFTLENCGTRERWLIEHKKGIGGSTAAAILGESRWKSPYAAWAEYTGILAPSDEENEAMRWGNLLEPVIADEWAYRTGSKLIDHGRWTIARSVEHPILLCTLDREIEPKDDRGPGVLEVKTTNAFMREEWSDEPPTQYQVQLQHQLLVTGAKWGVLCCLIGGQMLKWWETPRNDRFLSAHLKACLEFWRRVEENDPPPVDGSERTRDALLKQWPEDDGEAIALDQEAVQLDAEIADIGERIDDLTKQREERRNRMRQILGKAAVGILPGGGKWTYRTDARGVRALRRRG